jgi:ubiquinone/menaquinone biosynthesis C-methylase UbiE
MDEVRPNPDYIVASLPTELARLVGIARLCDEHVRDAFRRVPLGPGGTAIDCGCGALGALLPLSDLVGPAGTVVGVDMNAESLGHARTILDRAGRDAVRLVHANVNDLEPAQVCPPGPFDAAYCRFFLTHQRDPVATLRRMAAVVRPGGHVVAHEYIHGPCLPASEPPLPALDAYWGFVDGVLRRVGSPDVARQFRRLCAAAGLREVSQRGFLVGGWRNAREGVQVIHDSLVGIRGALLGHGAATAEDVDRVQAELAAALSWDFDIALVAACVELVAQVAGEPAG